LEYTKARAVLAVTLSIVTQGSPMQWSADVMERAHNNIVKEPARSGNNQKFDAQICRYLDHKEKCQLF